MIGPVTALGFVAALDDIARFEGPHQVAAYLGLVPNERSSGEQQHRGRITERGDSRTRWLLVEAAWRIRRSKTRRWRRSTRAPSGSRPAAASAAPRCATLRPASAPASRHRLLPNVCQNGVRRPVR